MTVELYKGINIYCVRQEGTGGGGGVTYDVGTLNGQIIYKRGLKTRAEAASRRDYPDQRPQLQTPANR
jgi:hypothetical protein